MSRISAREKHVFAVYGSFWCAEIEQQVKKKVKEVFPNLEGRDVCKREAEKLCDL